MKTLTVIVVFKLVTATFLSLFVFFIPATKANPSDFEAFPFQILSITFLGPFLILEKEPVFPFKVEC